MWVNTRYHMRVHARDGMGSLRPGWGMWIDTGDDVWVNARYLL